MSLDGACFLSHSTTLWTCCPLASSVVWWWLRACCFTPPKPSPLTPALACARGVCNGASRRTFNFKDEGHYQEQDIRSALAGYGGLNGGEDLNRRETNWLISQICMYPERERIPVLLELMAQPLVSSRKV